MLSNSRIEGNAEAAIEIKKPSEYLLSPLWPKRRCIRAFSRQLVGDSHLITGTMQVASCNAGVSLQIYVHLILVLRCIAVAEGGRVSTVISSVLSCACYLLPCVEIGSFRSSFLQSHTV